MGLSTDHHCLRIRRAPKPRRLRTTGSLCSSSVDSWEECSAESPEVGSSGGKAKRKTNAGCGQTGSPVAYALMSNTSSQWCSQPVAAAKLHVSERTLIRWRSSKFLTQGKHWRRALPSPRARVLYNVEQCEKDVAKACSREGSMLEQDINPAR